MEKKRRYSAHEASYTRKQKQQSVRRQQPRASAKRESECFRKKRSQDREQRESFCGAQGERFHKDRCAEGTSAAIPRLPERSYIRGSLRGGARIPQHGWHPVRHPDSRGGPYA